MMRNKTLSFLTFPFIIIISSFCLSSCTKQSKGVQHANENSGTGSTTLSGAAPILIGEISSMTGAEASYGMSAHNGILLAVKHQNEKGGINGKLIKMISLDSQGKPDEGARAMTKLTQQNGIAAIITGVISSNALAMAPIAQQKKIPMIATISTHPKVTNAGDFIFRVCLMDSFQGEIMAKFAYESLKLKKAAILQDIKSDYSMGLAEKFASVFKAHGGEIIASQTFSAGDVDFRAQLTAIRGKKPDLIYIPGYYSDVSLIGRQSKELGLHVPLLGSDGWDSDKLKEIGGNTLSGSYFSASYSTEQATDELKDFIKDYKNTYGITPDGLAVTGYEGGQVLIQALMNSKNLSPTEIREALATSSSNKTITGQWAFDSKRNAIRSAVVVKIGNDGHLQYQTTLKP